MCVFTMFSVPGPIPEWTVREQLILASAVQRSGDQNWYALRKKWVWFDTSFYIYRVSVSRAVKPLVEDVRPPDYFSQKACTYVCSSGVDNDTVDV